NRRSDMCIPPTPTPRASAKSNDGSPSAMDGAAMLALLLLGALLASHVPAGWKSARKKNLGIGILAAAAWLMISGHVLYYAGDETRNVVRGCRHDERIGSLREIRKCFHVLLRHLEVRRFQPALVDNGVGDRAHAGGGRLGNDSYGGRLALRPVDRRLLLALGPEHRGLLFAIGDVDLLLPLAFGFCDERAFFPLGGDLLLHR